MKIFFIFVGIVLIISGTLFLIRSYSLDYYLMILIGIVSLWIGVWNWRAGVK